MPNNSYLCSRCGASYTESDNFIAQALAEVTKLSKCKTYSGSCTATHGSHSWRRR